MDNEEALRLRRHNRSAGDPAAEAKQAGLLKLKLTGRTSKVALEQSAEAIRLQA